MGTFQIAIDGPAASGKSTVARRLAEKLNGHYINTGDMYRAVTWAAHRRHLNPRTDPEGVAEMLAGIDLKYVLNDAGVPVLILNGEPVPVTEIRAPDVAHDVSYVARIPEVREWLKGRQRETTALGTVIMEGRDIGTVILPDASHKFFITASPEVRARRRLAQDGEVADGATVPSVAAEIAERDRIDSTRATAPLRAAVDAVPIQTDHMTIEEVVDRMLTVILGETGG